MWVNSRCTIAAWLECFQEKPRTVSEWTGLPGEESVKRFERSNGLDTALYKTIPLPFFFFTIRANYGSSFFRNQFVTVLTARSASSLDRGYLGGLAICTNPYLKTNCLNISAAYCGPLSDITTSGMPWCANNYFKVFDDRIGVGSLELTDFEESQVIIDRNMEFRVMQVKQVCSHAFPWPPWKLSGSQCFARSAHICNLTRHVLPPVVPSGGPCICVCPDAPRISARRSLGIMIRDPSRRMLVLHSARHRLGRIRPSLHSLSWLAANNVRTDTVKNSSSAASPANNNLFS